MFFDESKGIVYFIKSNISDTYIKIGKTTNLNKRLEQIDVYNPLGVSVLGYIETSHFYGDIELKMHKYFNDKRIRREWFELSIDDIKSFLDKELESFLIERIYTRIPDIYIFNKKTYKHDKVEPKDIHRFINIYKENKKGFFKTRINIVVPKNIDEIFKREVPKHLLSKN